MPPDPCYITFVPEKLMIQVHPEKFIRCTPDALMWCNIINTYKRANPEKTFQQIAQVFNMSASNARRYYYGVHHRNHMAGCYNQVRKGACVAV